MSRKPATSKPQAQPPPEDLEALRMKLSSLEVEKSRMELLLEQGFSQFTEAAEKLQERIGNLHERLEQKNEELQRNLEEKERVKTYLANIFESLDIGVLVTDMEGQITSVNREGVNILGLGAEQLIGEDVNLLLGETLVTGGAAGKIEKEPITFKRQDAETVKLQLSVTGMPGGFILNVQDVTELKKLEETAERRNRFTAMGEMAANIAHEIRNPLGSIELFASLVQKGLPADSEQAQLVNHISSAVTSMNHIISNLLAYTKPRPVNRQQMDLQQLVAESAEFLELLAAKHEVAVAVHLEAERPLIRGDEEMLKQVVHNLFLNAVQAMPDGGELTIATRNKTLRDPQQVLRFHPEPPVPAELDVIEVTLQDQGSGMPMEIQRQIFDPFFTTKARGTGLGLAIVHNILESHLATIDVDSHVDVGTTMILTFPVAG